MCVCVSLPLSICLSRFLISLSCDLFCSGSYWHNSPEGSPLTLCLCVRLYHCRVRQGALHCLLVVVKGVEKRTLYGYWSSFIPDAPIGGPPPLTLLTIILKDPSPKVHAHTHAQ